MANSAYIKQPIQGIEGLRAVLKGLPEEVLETVLGAAVTEAAKPVVRAAKLFAPKDTGALRNSISAVVRKYKNSGKAVAVIGPARGYYRAGKKTKKGESVRGADAPANYGHLVEFGHLTVANRKGTSIRKGTATPLGFVPAQPFMRPAVIAAENETGAAMANGLITGIEKARQKLVSQYGHKR